MNYKDSVESQRMYHLLYQLGFEGPLIPFSLCNNCCYHNIIISVTNSGLSTVLKNCGNIINKMTMVIKSVVF